MKSPSAVRQFFKTVHQQACHAAAYKYDKKSEYQDLYDSSVAVMQRETQREVNTEHLQIMKSAILEESWSSNTATSGYVQHMCPGTFPSSWPFVKHLSIIIVQGHPRNGRPRRTRSRRPRSRRSREAWWMELCRLATIILVMATTNDLDFVWLATISRLERLRPNAWAFWMAIIGFPFSWRMITSFTRTSTRALMTTKITSGCDGRHLSYSDVRDVRDCHSPFPVISTAFCAVFFLAQGQPVSLHSWDVIGVLSDEKGNTLRLSLWSSSSWPFCQWRSREEEESLQCPVSTVFRQVPSTLKEQYQQPQDGGDPDWTSSTADRRTCGSAPVSGRDRRRGVHTLTCCTHIFLHITRAHLVCAYFAHVHACHTHTHLLISPSPFSCFTPSPSAVPARALRDQPHRRTHPHLLAELSRHQKCGPSALYTKTKHEFINLKEIVTRNFYWLCFIRGEKFGKKIFWLLILKNWKFWRHKKFFQKTERERSPDNPKRSRMCISFVVIILNR